MDLLTPIGTHVWQIKYRYVDAGGVHDRTVEDTWRRVARAVARAEHKQREQWERRFHDLLASLRFLPGGRILAGAGTTRRVTLFNCFVAGPIEDSLSGILAALREASLTLQEGGGVGCDFSTLRPRGTSARATGGVASGPASFMDVWDGMCATLLSTSARRGAMMATLRCDHPDVEEFLEAKRAPGRLRHFNLSVQVTDAFLDAVRSDRPWQLVFPLRSGERAPADEIVTRVWSGAVSPVACRIARTVRARELWGKILRAAYDCGEPGVLLVDHINRMNNLSYRERLSATNPCGELPLPAYGACDLGSLNLTRYIVRPFARDARLDMEGLGRDAALAVRFLDDVIDVSRYPLEEQRGQALGARRIGLGVTGLADALVMLGLRYQTEEAREAAASAVRAVCHAAYGASAELAREKCSFSFYERAEYAASPFLQSALPEPLRERIARGGIRNSHLMALAPAGSISLLAGNVSSGIEPVFRADHLRRMREADGSARAHAVTDWAVALWRGEAGVHAAVPPAFVDVRDVAPEAQVAMQAALQPWVDGGISKTVTVPEDFGLARFEALFDVACRSGLKGFAAYREQARAGEVLMAEGEPDERCCEVGSAAG
jgi:ribonucleoside-diphosphate reductase alpha chain